MPKVPWLRYAWLRDHIGVIVTDHLMPGGGGPQLVRRVRAENDWIPIIVLSGMPDAMSDYKGLEVVFRAKPFPPPELIELVRLSLAEANRHRGAVSIKPSPLLLTCTIGKVTQRCDLNHMALCAQKCYS